jgi:hypothetical protein
MYRSSGRRSKPGFAPYATGHDEPLAGMGSIPGRSISGCWMRRTAPEQPVSLPRSTYRGDPRLVDQRILPERLSARTGMQRLPFNTLYQLISMQRATTPSLPLPTPSCSCPTCSTTDDRAQGSRVHQRDDHTIL